MITPKGEWVQYSTPGAEGAEYVAVCLPAFSPETVRRDDGVGTVAGAPQSESWIEAQQAISLRKNQALVGKQLEILVEGEGEIEGSGATQQ